MAISENGIKKRRLSQIERELFKGFIRIHIQHHASEGRENLLSSERSTVAGKARKYYRVTEEGRGMLTEAKEYLHELVDEVLGERCL
jgi:hypothetical protein